MLLAENGGATYKSDKRLGKETAGVFLHVNVPQQQRKQTQRNLKKLKPNFLRILRLYIAKLKDIPPELVINWDQTAVKYVPVSLWTPEKKGAKCVEIVSTDDKRQITATVAGTMSGEFLPAQLIYGGKTSACLPKIDFPACWMVHHFHNH